MDYLKRKLLLLRNASLRYIEIMPGEIFAITSITARATLIRKLNTKPATTISTEAELYAFMRALRLQRVKSRVQADVAVQLSLNIINKINAQCKIAVQADINNRFRIAKKQPIENYINVNTETKTSANSILKRNILVNAETESRGQIHALLLYMRNAPVKIEMQAGMSAGFTIIKKGMWASLKGTWADLAYKTWEDFKIQEVI
jgi:hypothetical protein